ncbi:MAG: hydrogenase maturation protease [Candidatus Omnitrophota bacterium]
MKNFKVLSSPELRSTLKDRIKGRPAIVGIGNIMRGDDGLGPRLVELLKARAVNARLFDCGTAPENYIFPILSTDCNTIILVDAADFSERAGDINIFDLEEISKVSFSTHNPSPRLLTDLLRTGRDNLDIFVISVQPKTTTLGEGISREVNDGLDLLADIFQEILK